MSARARDYQPGERLPGTVYDVVRLIGAGGMGTVYDVVDSTIGKRYVLKTLHPQLGARQDLARRMQNEARTLARLNHPNIVDVITAGVTGDLLRLPYYVMERLNGQSLRVVLEKKGQLELSQACHVAIDLLDALDHAHDKGVIHRDVKPDNIFLHRTSAGVTVTKLLDFGILSLLDDTRHETAGRFLGTLRYAAPEQLHGDTPTPRVDVYAAGLVLYEMIAGRGPFDDEGDPRAIGAAHLEKPPPPLSRFAAVPQELEALVLAALAKAQASRPPDAFSFATSLRALKRTLSGWQPNESTEDRATAAAILGPEDALAAYVEVRHPLTDGPYVISPARELPPGTTALPNTTRQGIAQPTLGPSLVGPTRCAPTATIPETIDRRAPTNSLVPHAVASPQHGTEPFELPASESPQSPLVTSLQSVDEPPLRWADERPPATSEAPQIQTLSAWVPRGRFAVVPRVTAVATLGIVTIAGAFILLSSRKAPGDGARPPGAMAAEALSSAPTADPIPPPPSVPVAATTPVESLQTPSLKGPVMAPAPSQTRKPKIPSAASTPKPTAPPARTDRPGPGF